MTRHGVIVMQAAAFKCAACRHVWTPRKTKRAKRDRCPACFRVLAPKKGK